jgi:hypothetical protein
MDHLGNATLYGLGTKCCDRSSIVATVTKSAGGTDLAEVHRAIIRVERAIADQLLFTGVARDVVPMPPLGLLQVLDSLYVSASANSIANMQGTLGPTRRRTKQMGHARDCVHRHPVSRFVSLSGGLLE